MQGVLAMAVLAGGGVHAATISGTKLTTVEVTGDLRSDIKHADDNYESQVFHGNAFGTFMAVDNGGAQAAWPLFYPGGVDASDFASGVGTWTAGMQAVSGAGTIADPWKIVTSNVLAGSTGLSITQTDTLVAPDESYRTDITVTNTGATARTFILWRAMDCTLGGPGFDEGFSTMAGSTVGCVRRDTKDAGGNTVPNTTDPNLPISRVEQLIDLTGSARKQGGFYSPGGGVWNMVSDRSEFTNQCLTGTAGQYDCSAYLDNGMGLSWKVSIPAGGSHTFSHRTLVSPTGQIVQPPAPPGPAPGSAAPVPASNPLALALGASALCTMAWRRRRTGNALR